MTTVAASYERRDVRTILTSGAGLGVTTAVGVAAFALLSRSLEGTVEVVAQSVIILFGGMVATFGAARNIRPRTIDAIGWCALAGLMGAGVFTVLDIALLRPLGLYHWTWDAIGGGSGWWYIPIWWMGAAFLAWLGAWSYANRARDAEDANLATLGAQVVIGAVVVWAALALTGVTPFNAAAAALAFALSLVVQVPLSAAMGRR